MPDLVDLVGRRHGMAGMHGQEAKPPVLLDRLGCEIARPAVVASEPRRERERRVGGVEVEPSKDGSKS